VRAADALELPLAFPWPELEGALCHPSLAITAPAGGAGIGPYRPAKERNHFEANAAFPLGRAFPDQLALTFTDERAAARLFALGRVHLALGISDGRAPPLPGPALYATYLAFSPEKVGADFRLAFESALDRNDLTRLFLPTAAVPLHALLPPALMAPVPLARPSVPSPSANRALVLAFDRSLPEHRSVAERIQVKLHELNYRLALKPLSRSQLRAGWASGNFDLMLHSILLPPAAPVALALAIELSGRHELLRSELPPIGAQASPGERDAMARQRAAALLPELPLIPLYAQSTVLLASSEVAGLHADNQGVPALDDASLAPEHASPRGE
jgi:MarR-like DNA-binding transcriptional regulator SgrR of sgrS sRNA